MGDLKKNNSKILAELSGIIDESLGLLKKENIHGATQPTYEKLPPSLLDQCLELCEHYRYQEKVIVRTLHHFGLPLDSPLFSSLATLPNTCVLKDIHPNNNSFKNSLDSQTLVAKSILPNEQLRSSTEGNENQINKFLNDLQQRLKKNSRMGKQLLICENHCLKQLDRQNSQDLLVLLNRLFSTLSLIVISEPVDSFYSYCSSAQSDSLELNSEDYFQYVLNFIRAHPNLTVIRYEDFIAAPKKVMQEICTVLNLPYCEHFLDLKEVFGTANDNSTSTKKVTKIIFENTYAYQQLCKITGYENNYIDHIAQNCLTSNDIHQKIDSYLFNDNLSDQEKFQLCNLLSEKFYIYKDVSMAQHFVARAQDFLSKEIDISNKQKTFLSKLFIKYGCTNDALNLVVQRLILDNDFSEKEAKILLNSYEQLQGSRNEKNQHGHEVLLKYMKTNVVKFSDNNIDRKPVLIEIGTTREDMPAQGSTKKLANYCNQANVKFITVDMDVHNTLSAHDALSKISSDFQAINMKGEDFLKNYVGEIDYIFLDAYDFDHGNHSELRQSRYIKFLGGRIDAEQCHKMHLECAKILVNKLSSNGVVCIDDTWLDNNGLWCAKGTLAVPYFLENGFDLIEARNRAALLKRQLS